MIRRLLTEIKFKYRSRIIGKLWKARHKKVFNSNGLQRVKLTNYEKKEYLDYWSGLGESVCLDTVELCKSLSGKYSKFIIPEEIFALRIEGFLNKRREVSYLENKSIGYKWFGEIFPKDYFHKVNGEYLTKDFLVISDIYNYIKNDLKISYPLVLKPNVDTFGGKGVTFINGEEDLLQSLNLFENYVVQEKIIQHPQIDKINNSINTVRVCLYKSILNGEIKFLNASIRMGINGGLDNETAGGIVCNISKQGVFNEYAVDKYAKKYFSHPNSNYFFKDEKLEEFDQLVMKAIEVGQKIIGARLLSLDMCLDNEGKWRCLEVNLFGQTIRFAQYAGNPFLGEYTEEIIKLLKKN